MELKFIGSGGAFTMNNYQDDRDQDAQADGFLGFVEKGQVFA